ncbi:MAG: ABC-ATPase domain-containing protein [Candidatus Aerophobetes bacterium]|nr:ABC-ATPase domain-containing protein [Candidatus Aerophobetes bacterium]
MRAVEDLKSILKRIDGRGYKAYRDIKGQYKFENFELYIDHVQADPYASPSKVRARVRQKTAGFPLSLFKNRIRKIALEDYFARTFYQNIKQISKGHRDSGKSGSINILPCSQQILERTSISVNEDIVEARFTMGLPAKGRRILSKEASEMFFEEIPPIIGSSLFYKNLKSGELKNHIEVAEDAEYIRKHLKEKNLIAFVASGSCLPRASGVDERPLRKEKAILFKSPSSLEVSFHPPHKKEIRGMGIPQGITLIVGGGYHGKSTLLNALAVGCYNHIPKDGREFVVSSPDTVKIRAEDGRFIKNTDISPFIHNLPSGEDTRFFSTLNASGSTSQASNIIEALEIGAKVLLIDEDTSATNFMVRDRRMQELVNKEKEPITPLIDKIRLLYKELKVSAILVMGGSGDYFDVADTVILMDTYQPVDASEKAKSISNSYKLHRSFEGGSKFGVIKDRMPLPESFRPYRGRGDKVKIKSRGINGIDFGYEKIDLSSVEQLVEEGQTRSIGDLIYYAGKEIFDGKITLKKALKLIEERLKENLLDSIFSFLSGEYAIPRKYEIAAAINRLHTLKCEDKKSYKRELKSER